MRVRGESGEFERRYAIIRSVAVRAPIEALQADERHRLGIIFLVEPDADLALLRDQIIDETRVDERRRLAGLLSHGVDSLARVLARQHDDGTVRDGEFAGWLAGYIERRKGYDYREHAKKDAAHLDFVTEDVVQSFGVLGEPEQHVEKLKELEAIGVTQFNIYLMNTEEERIVAEYADKIIPHFR